jgi:DNA (cytosine-5)-methyltransferase 1
MLQNQMIPIGGLYTQDSQAFHRGVLDDCSRTLKADTHDAGVMCEVAVKEATKQGFSVAKGVDMANTLDTSCNQGIFVEISPSLTVYAIWYPKKQCHIAIRKLTPKECFRLQGWTDDYFAKAQLVNSDSQLYKQAGNGVTVNVIEAIANKMRLEDTDGN